MNTRETLIARSIPFLEEIKDLTPGNDAEKWLNSTYGPGTDLYDELASLIQLWRLWRTDRLIERWARALCHV